jgi:hypothetical protein
MNGKQVRRIHRLAMTKAHSQNDTTTEGVRARKLHEMENYAVNFDALSNIVNGHWVQRKLHSFSLKRISKTIKNLFKNTPRARRPALLAALEEDLSPIGV